MNLGFSLSGSSSAAITPAQTPSSPFGGFFKRNSTASQPTAEASPPATPGQGQPGDAPAPEATGAAAGPASAAGPGADGEGEEEDEEEEGGGPDPVGGAGETQTAPPAMERLSFVVRTAPPPSPSPVSDAPTASSEGRRPTLPIGAANELPPALPVLPRRSISISLTSDARRGSELLPLDIPSPNGAPPSGRRPTGDHAVVELLRRASVASPLESPLGGPLPISPIALTPSSGGAVVRRVSTVGGPPGGSAPPSSRKRSSAARSPSVAGSAAPEAEGPGASAPPIQFRMMSLLSPTGLGNATPTEGGGSGRKAGDGGGEGSPASRKSSVAGGGGGDGTAAETPGSRKASQAGVEGEEKAKDTSGGGGIFSYLKKAAEALTPSSSGGFLGFFTGEGSKPKEEAPVDPKVLRLLEEARKKWEYEEGLEKYWAAMGFDRTRLKQLCADVTDEVVAEAMHRAQLARIRKVGRHMILSALAVRLNRPGLLDDDSAAPDATPTSQAGDGTTKKEWKKKMRGLMSNIAVMARRSRASVAFVAKVQEEIASIRSGSSKSSSTKSGRKSTIGSIRTLFATTNVLNRLKQKAIKARERKQAEQKDSDDEEQVEDGSTYSSLEEYARWLSPCMVQCYQCGAACSRNSDQRFSIVNTLRSVQPRSDQRVLSVFLPNAEAWL
jgi:hypothetical protein